MELLIDCVRKYPCLWQVDLPEYKNSEIKEAAWQKVFNECDFPNVQEAKILWKKLRDSHRQAINGKKKQTASPRSKWKYEKQMEFLLPFMKNRTTRSHMQTTNQTLQNKDVSSQGSPSEEQIKKTKTLQSIVKEEQKTEKAMKRMLLRNQILENLPKKAESNKSSALDKFFLCMSETTSELPEYLQIGVQRQIFNIVMEAKEQYLLEKRPGIDTHQFESVLLDHVPTVHRFSGETVSGAS